MYRTMGPLDVTGLHLQDHNGKFTAGGAHRSMRGGGLMHPGTALARPGTCGGGRPCELPLFYVHACV